MTQKELFERIKDGLSTEELVDAIRERDYGVTVVLVKKAREYHDEELRAAAVKLMGEDGVTAEEEAQQACEKGLQEE